MYSILDIRYYVYLKKYSCFRVAYPNTAPPLTMTGIALPAAPRVIPFCIDGAEVGGSMSWSARVAIDCITVKSHLLVLQLLGVPVEGVIFVNSLVDFPFGSYVLSTLLYP